MGGPKGMDQITKGKKEEIDKDFIDNLLESYSKRLIEAQKEIEKLKHENAILKERIDILMRKE